MPGPQFLLSFLLYRLPGQAKEGSKSAMFFYPNNQTGVANHLQARLKLTSSDSDNDCPWPPFTLTLKANFTIQERERDKCSILLATRFIKSNNQLLGEIATKENKTQTKKKRPEARKASLRKKFCQNRNQ
uniref:Uncharacterized protein n=1 Tax=Glossina austeni TaxID=7395 RepID=A0A1A9VWB5_GLOAU